MTRYYEYYPPAHKQLHEESSPQLGTGREAPTFETTPPVGERPEDPVHLVGVGHLPPAMGQTCRAECRLLAADTT